MVRLSAAFLVLSYSAFPVARASSDLIVETPNGPRSRESVIKIENGIVTNGVAISSVDRRSPLGQSADDSGWITYSLSEAPAGKSVQRLFTQWRVPEAPALHDQQLLYLFNALMDSNKRTILQPVLQWGESDAGGGNFWSVASWFVDLDGRTYHTQAIRVAPGQLLSGLITVTPAGGAPLSYHSEFVGIPGTQLSIQQPLPLTFATETLEAYYVYDCAEYPTTALTAFTDISMLISDGTSSLHWNPFNRTTDCGQHTTILNDSSTSGEVDLYYRN